MNYPAIDTLVTKAAAARSVSDVLTTMSARELSELERDIGRLARLVRAGGKVTKSGNPERARLLAKAAEYEQNADRVISPADREGYLELARRERERAGVA